MIHKYAVETHMRILYWCIFFYKCQLRFFPIFYLIFFFRLIELNSFALFHFQQILNENVIYFIRWCLVSVFVSMFYFICFVVLISYFGSFSYIGMGNSFVENDPSTKKKQDSIEIPKSWRNSDLNGTFSTDLTGKVSWIKII